MVVRCQEPTAGCPLPGAHRRLSAARSPPPVVRCQELTAGCPLPGAHRRLSAARSPPPPMTPRRSCPPAPGPLEDYAQQFDPLFSSLAQRRGLRDYLQGLLLPRDRNKTLTGLAGAEPISGAQHREVQRLQWFLTESTWDHQQVNDRRVRLLCEDPATAPHEQGAL